MQIGELARRFDVAASKIRFLEDQGLVQPARRTQAGYREYDESSAEALGMILQAQALGFTLDEIKGALAETRSHGLRRDYLIGQIARKMSELDRHIAQTLELRARLVCASKELKKRLKNGATCDTRPVAPPPVRTARQHPPQRGHRRAPAIAG